MSILTSWLASPPPDAVIEVADTGVGMTDDVLEHVFEPFFTTKPAGKGTGLGLSMVYGFAQQSRGFCEVLSRPGEGTRVRLYLPRHEGPVLGQSCHSTLSRSGRQLVG